MKGVTITNKITVEASMSGKWVELLNEVAPRLRRVVMMFNPDTAPGGGSSFAKAFEDAARSFKLEPISAPVHEVPILNVSFRGSETSRAAAWW
jgi:putative tryptophan/tyrosine transport system substrate-binding protein